MVKSFLNFLKNYWFCFLLSVIMVIGVYLSARYASLYKTGNDGDMIRFDLGDLFLIFGLPLYSLIYGCISYTILKKVWGPQLILFAMTYLYFSTYGIDAFFWVGTYICSVYPTIFSLIGTGITKFVYYIIKESKKNTGNGDDLK